MTPTEAAALLTVAAAFDNRKPDADAATAWAMALDDLRFIDCRDAIVAHYRRSTEWVMPAMVRAGVSKLRADRIKVHPVPHPPAHLDPDEPDAYTRWLLTTRQAIADGETLEPEPPRELTGRPADLDFTAAIKAPPRTTVADTKHTPEYRAGLERVRAELASRPPLPEPPTIDELTARDPVLAARLEHLRATVPGVAVAADLRAEAVDAS